MKDSFTLKGRVHVVLAGPDGKVIKEEEGENLVTTNGKAFVATALITLTASTFGYVAIGTSNAAVAVGQTALQGSELARVAATTSNPTSTTTKWIASFGAGVGTGTIEETGIFNAGAAGTMLNRYLTGTYVKGALDTLTVTWTVTVS